MNWLSKLKSGLSKTSGKLSDGITGIFTKRKLDDETLEQLEELLIEADMGASVAATLAGALRKQKFGKEVSDEEVCEVLADDITGILQPVARPLVIDAAQKPYVILVVGVNGNGKTTTTAKLAAKLQGEGRRVMFAAADTFRAAAMEQLRVWAERLSIPLIAGEANADPASVAFRALEEARAAGADVLFIDTAGRLHNKADLMAELQKIIRVLKKLDDSAPHAVLQVLDATTGGNAVQQVETFRTMVGVSGLIVTKLDGTAKGGIIVALAQKFGLPIHAIGVGEGSADLDAFEAGSFARQLVAAKNGA